MKVYKGIGKLENRPKNSVVTIGNFDGVHLGHQEVFSKIVQKAQRTSAGSVAVTFRPHPNFVLRPSAEPFLLTTYDEKIELIQAAGIQTVVEEPFSREFSNISPEDFIDKYLIAGLGAKSLILGYDFAFGKERSGSLDVMKKLADTRGLDLEVVPPLKIEGEIVSSSLIRKYLSEGSMQSVNRLLGREMSLKGFVWRGEGRGTGIGIPTANLLIEERKYPALGVYFTKVLWDGKELPSITNVGINPTFLSEDRAAPLKVETHIFDFKEQIYGDEITVKFYKFHREEKKFASVNDLLEQIKKDLLLAREFHNNKI
ncbi:MAG: bifunctional riboflavin kinase/FAD synthetase [Oligoflexia bacterium]|nr:bifunctional riboflavin kinase/FAD synthetase [Oligoflexia bacterium]